MPQAVPKGLNREHVLQALADLDAGVEHPFGSPTGYEVVHEGRRYPPKAVIGLACRSLLGRVLRPEEFSGGEAVGQANFVLRGLGFDVVPTGVGTDDSLLLLGNNAENAIRREHDRRMAMWSDLLRSGGPSGVAPARLRELGIYGGAQGIWVDKVRTGGLTTGGSGVTVGVLHTGLSYADDLAEDCILYHYPSTRRPPGRDAAEVNATKAAGQRGLPFFVITYPAPHANARDVRLGWVESWDDETRTFLISFERRPPTRGTPLAVEDEPFELVAEGPRPRREVATRPGQQRFKFRVLQRYGPRCVACGLDVLDLLDAAHLRPVHAAGSDDPRNGLVLCPTHHRAFDLGLFAIEPESLRIVCRDAGPDAARLGVIHDSLGHLQYRPHVDALRWAWAHRLAAQA